MTTNLPQASTVAANFDRLYDFIFWVSAVSFFIIVAGLIVFSIKYSRKRKGETTPYIEGHTPTEAAVAGILFILVMVIFWWGYKDYSILRTMPYDAMEINVVGRMWTWDFQYPNGRKTTNELVVPKGKRIKLIMTSQDVIHSFYVPNFRIKQDLLPNTYTAVWFEPILVGDNDVFCAEYCGTGHSQMIAKLSVVTPEAYEEWQADWELEGVREATRDSGPVTRDTGPVTLDHQAPAEKGKTVFTERGCPACHSTDGSARVGPTLMQLFGREEEMKDGAKIIVDENYIRESLVDPASRIVKGYDPVMPVYKGQLKDDEITALIEYIKSLK